MGRVTLTLPCLGETMEEARVTDWLVAPGAAFARGDVLLEVETDKTVVEVPALEGGTLVAQLVAPGDTVALDQPIAEVEVEGVASTPAPTAVNAMGIRGSGALGQAMALGQSGSPDAAIPAPTDTPPGGGGVAPVARAVAGTLGQTMALGHPSAGTVQDTTGASPPPRGEGMGVGGPATERVAASPAARSAARRSGVDLAMIEGTGRRGRIQSWDVEGGRAATVVLIHGLFDSPRGWRDLPGRLRAAGHAVVTPDLPGHGAAAAVATFDAAVEHLAADLPSGPLHLVGHSLGAALTVRLAVLLGPRVQRLVLSAPAGLGPRINSDFIDGMLAAETPAALARTLALLDAGPVSASALAAELDRLCAERAGHAALARAVASAGFQQIDITGDLAGLSCPVAVLFGTADRILTWQDAANLPPAAALHLVRGAGHLPHLAVPDLFLALATGDASPARRIAHA